MEILSALGHYIFATFRDKAKIQLRGADTDSSKHKLIRS